MFSEEEKLKLAQIETMLKGYIDYRFSIIKEHKLCNNKLLIAAMQEIEIFLPTYGAAATSEGRTSSLIISPKLSEEQIASLPEARKQQLQHYLSIKLDLTKLIAKDKQEQENYAAIEKQFFFLAARVYLLREEHRGVFNKIIDDMSSFFMSQPHESIPRLQKKYLQRHPHAAKDEFAKSIIRAMLMNIDEDYEFVAYDKLLRNLATIKLLPGWQAFLERAPWHDEQMYDQKMAELQDKLAIQNDLREQAVKRDILLNNYSQEFEEIADYAEQINELEQDPTDVDQVSTREELETYKLNLLYELFLIECIIPKIESLVKLLKDNLAQAESAHIKAAIAQSEQSEGKMLLTAYNNSLPKDQQQITESASSNRHAKERIEKKKSKALIESSPNIELVKPVASAQACESEQETKFTFELNQHNHDLLCDFFDKPNIKSINDVEKKIRALALALGCTVATSGIRVIIQYLSSSREYNGLNSFTYHKPHGRDATRFDPAITARFVEFLRVQQFTPENCIVELQKQRPTVKAPF